MGNTNSLADNKREEAEARRIFESNKSFFVDPVANDQDFIAFYTKNNLLDELKKFSVDFKEILRGKSDSFFRGKRASLHFLYYNKKFDLLFSTEFCKFLIKNKTNSVMLAYRSKGATHSAEEKGALLWGAIPEPSEPSERSGSNAIADAQLGKKVVLSTLYNTDKGVYAALRAAIKRNNYAMVKALLDGGADPNQQSDRKLKCIPPLHLAVKLGNREVMQLLLARGAKLGLVYQGKTAFSQINRHYSNFLKSKPQSDEYFWLTRFTKFADALNQLQNKGSGNSSYRLKENEALEKLLSSAYQRILELNNIGEDSLTDLQEKIIDLKCKLAPDHAATGSMSFFGKKFYVSRLEKLIHQTEAEHHVLHGLLYSDVREELVGKLEAYKKYRDAREANRYSYFSWYTKKDKLNAAFALTDAIKNHTAVDKKHIGALRNGTLGETIRSYIKSIDPECSVTSFIKMLNHEAGYKASSAPER